MKDVSGAAFIREMRGRNSLDIGWKPEYSGWAFPGRYFKL
jgi:hypothetical protein